MLQDDAPVQLKDQVIIAGGPKSRHRAWPALEIASNGDLLVAYAESDDHHRTNDGALVLARSIDGGRTWPFSKAVAAEPGWDLYTNHGMTRLTDGTLLLHVVRGRREEASNAFYARGSFTRSTDNGHIWEVSGPQLDYPFVSQTGRAFSYGRVAELPGGKLMVPFYGEPRYSGDPRCRVVAVAFSDDGGRSWPDYAIIHEDRTAQIGPSEADILRLSDGRWLMIVRANIPGLLYQSYSSDEGRTWSAIKPTELPGNCPALIALASGDILCAYRDVTPDQPGMGCAVSRDLGQTWAPLGHLYRGENRDCAYPSMLHLDNEQIFCAFYTARDAETGGCEIHGLFLLDRTAG